MGDMSEIEIKIPNLGDAEETEVIEISIEEGQEIKENDPLIVLESEKAAMEVPSDYKGTIKKVIIKEGDSVKEGDTFAVLEIKEGEEQTIEISDNETKKTPNKHIPAKKEEINFNFSGINAGPAVRKIAREFEIDLKKIAGSGKNSLITKDDLKKFIHSSSSIEQGYISEDELKQFGKYVIEKQSKIRSLGAKNLHKSWTSVPHVTHFEEIDITKIEKQRNALSNENKVKITPLAYIVFFIVECLKEFPIFNSSLVGDGELMIRKYFNIGVAVDTPDGLLVPVMKNVDKLKIIDIASEILNIAQKAKNKKLFKDDLSGGTFSISSLGPIGGTGFTPIINPPEVAIIGVSRSKIVLTLENKTPIEKIMLPITLSYDHRVINGADAGKFMNSLKEKIEKGL